jgi:LmbE family N-acetylglucosaminyl deacetylase
VELIVDEDHHGPSEETWNARVARTEISALGMIHERRVVIIAPHPDDEVLGAGGLIQTALRERCLVEVVAVTDGEASHPAAATLTARRLASLRAEESDVALRRLGWRQPTVTRLRLPDGELAQRQDELFAALADTLLPDDLCVAPWSGDGHPDHDATAAAALRAARGVGARSLGYLVWGWHWADPEGSDIPWTRCRRLELGRRDRARKRWSTTAFQSQIRPLGPSSDRAPILPEHVLRRFWRPYEIFVDETEMAQ